MNQYNTTLCQLTFFLSVNQFYAQWNYRNRKGQEEGKYME